MTQTNIDPFEVVICQDIINGQKLNERKAHQMLRRVKCLGN
jgi:hypothetical protein